MEELKYEISKRATDAKDSIIKKTGATVEFSMGQVEASEAQLEKVKRELQGQVDVETAKMANIEVHHPFVLKLSEQEMFVAHMYQGAKAIVLVGKQKVEDIQKALDDYKLEKEEIRKQIPDLDVPAEAKVDEDNLEKGVPSLAEFLPGAEDGPSVDNLK